MLVLAVETYLGWNKEKLKDIAGNIARCGCPFRLLTRPLLYSFNTVVFSKNKLIVLRQGLHIWSGTHDPMIISSE